MTDSDTLMPTWSPPFGGPPYPMISAELLMVEFEADRAEIERITPAPLEPADHNRLMAFVGDCSQLSHSYDYHEVAIVQSVKYKGKSAVTTPYIWTSTDTALLAGRELYGMPKMLCDHEQIQKASNEVTGYLRRNGTDMMALSMNVMGPGDPAEIPLGPTFAFVRHIPSPDPDVPAIQQLVWIELEDFAVQSCWTGKGHIEIQHPLSSGLDRLGIGEITGAWHGTFSWLLPAAKILEQREIKAGEVKLI